MKGFPFYRVWGRQMLTAPAMGRASPPSQTTPPPFWLAMSSSPSGVKSKSRGKLPPLGIWRSTSSDAES